MAQDEQINDNPVSIRQGIIKKYDVNRDGVFDTNEINCMMDDFMFITQTNKSLVDTVSNQKKLLSGAFLLIVLLTLSNLGTSFIAVNMSKEVVVVDGKIMANGGSQEEAISTMTSVRTLTKMRGERNRRLLTGDNSTTGDTGDAVVCFTDDEVQKLLLNAMDGSGTNVVVQGSNSTEVININGGGLFEEGNYTFSNGVQFVVDVNDICEEQTQGRSLGNFYDDMPEFVHHSHHIMIRASGFEHERSSSLHSGTTGGWQPDLVANLPPLEAEFSTIIDLEFGF